MCDRNTITVPAYADDSAPVVVHVNEDRTCVFVSQGKIDGDLWTGDRVSFAIENADAVIDAIRAAVEAAKR